MIESLPIGLRNALESGDCVLFLGAGLGRHSTDGNGQPAPDARTLATELAEKFAIADETDHDLSTIAQVVDLRYGRPDLRAFLRERFADLTPDAAFQWLTTIRWKGICTTNYDRALLRAYELNPSPRQLPVPMSVTSELRPYDLRTQVPVKYLHGFLYDDRDSPIIITEDDYARFREKRDMLFKWLKLEFATSPFLYIGYSNSDNNWRALLEEIRAEFYPSSLPQSYRVSPDTSDLDIEILKSKSIETLRCTFEEFHTAAAATVITGGGLDEAIIKKAQTSVPTDLIPAFEKNAAPVIRLLASWEYVNQEAYTERPNTKAFLKGDRPNWALIGQHIPFTRDAEEATYDALIEQFVTISKNPSSVVLLGPAGYGVTTLLMMVAARLASDKAGPVFRLRDGATLIAGDIEFAQSLFSDVVFFFIDNASDWAGALPTVVHQFRDANKPAIFVLGERLNEWRQRPVRMPGKSQEVLLEPLTDAEIPRLLDCLRTANELGVLRDLRTDLQVLAIKEKHDKQLLVAMREATEGRAFDAILEGEYWGISEELARQLYAVVCCFHQYGLYVRDSLLSEMLGVPLEELYTKTSASTEGVVIYDEIDTATGHFGARTRHRTIASIVWQRLEAIERDEILLRIIPALNLNYGLDVRAFEELIRDDTVVDSIRTFEGKVAFFEAAAKKDPASPYVKQHFARMLSRERRYSLALSQIDDAIKEHPGIRVLHHSRGHILSLIMRDSPSPEMARRRMMQSEEAYRRCLSLDPRDEYAYQGLASLFLDWAKRVTDPAESAEYISKAEATIGEGLRKVRQRDGLYIVSAEIYEWLGQEPKRIEALERAVSNSPSGVIARSILARTYISRGEPGKAVDIIEPVLKEQLGDFRLYLLYATAKVCLGASYSEAVAILRLSDMSGLNDPRYIATLGGMLFMDKQFTAAKEVFAESERRALPAPEAAVIHFRPFSREAPHEPVRLEGRVVQVRPGYAIIDNVEYGQFLCPGSKWGKLLMVNNLRVTFEPAFSARGPIADNPREKT